MCVCVGGGEEEEGRNGWGGGVRDGDTGANPIPLLISSHRKHHPQTTGPISFLINGPRKHHP